MKSAAAVNQYACQATAIRPTWNRAPSEPGIDEGLQILVVEDDVADAYLIECALQDDPRVGTVRHASDGLEALGLFDRGEVSPDLVVIDLHMPRMNGFQLLEELSRRENAPFAMYVLTSSTARTDFVWGKLRGADLILTKPDTLAQLKVVLRDAINAL
jgi:CheY-like chemotaxis protein